MMAEEKSFSWDWANFFIYGLVWLIISSVAGFVFNREHSVYLSRADLECLYEDLRSDIELTEEQEMQISQKCGTNPCERYFGCAVDETNPNACDGSDECYNSPESKKYYDCSLELEDSMLRLSALVYMPDSVLREKLKNCRTED